MSTIIAEQREAQKLTLTIRILYACGIASSVFYVALNIFILPAFPGYDWVFQTVSELSAIGAPSRQLWNQLVIFYPILLGAFGYGVWRSAADNRPLRVAGILIMVYCLINLYWPPMHLRGSVTSLTDTLHLVWAGMSVLLMLLIMGFSAAALTRRFMIYTLVSMVLMVLFGVLTSLEAPNIPRNEPTPLLGVWERIDVFLFMVWVVVLALKLRLRKENYSSP